MKITVLSILGLLSLGAAASAAPIVVGGVSYTPVDVGEALTASFLKPDGGVTAGAYRGLVQISITGTAQSDAAFVNDAFYLIGDTSVGNDASYYQLTFGTSALLPFTPSQDAKNFLVEDLSTGAAGIPAYNPAHAYQFVLDTGTTTPTALHFGVSDGIFSDNTGAYAITVTQLAAVPEPASLGLLATASLAQLLRRRRSLLSRN